MTFYPKKVKSNCYSPKTDILMFLLRETNRRYTTTIEKKTVYFATDTTSHYPSVAIYSDKRVFEYEYGVPYAT